jgi:tetratricopeptide (TPR) repeat protein
MATNELFHEAQDSFIHGRLRESIDGFTRAHDEGYDPVRSYLSRGVVFLKMEDFFRAIDDFSAAIELEPDNERGYYFRGIAFLNKNEFELARQDLTHSLHLNPSRGTAFFARGLVETEMGLDDEAVTDFKAAVAYSDVETSTFAHSFGSYHTMFERSMALIEGERGPLTMVLTEEEIKKLEKWIEH